jgi:hypothetical protein
MSSRRITVRLDGLLSECLQQKCREIGGGVSYFTRKALEHFLNAGGDGRAAPAPGSYTPSAFRLSHDNMAGMQAR